MWRSGVAIVAGYLTMMLGVTTFFAFIVMVVLGGRPDDPSSFQPPDWLTWVELIVTPIFAALGGYVCAWIARRQVMLHALVLTGVMLAMGVVTLYMEPGHKPLWSTLAAILLGVCAAPIGSRIRMAHEAIVA